MRLREIKEILEENVKSLKLRPKEIPGKSDYDISNMSEVQESIMNISGFGFLEGDIAKLEEMPYIFNNKNTKIVVSRSEFNKMDSIVSDINQKVNAVILAISEALPEQEKNSVSIKLPDFVDLKKIGKTFDDLDTILNQSLVGEYQGGIKLQNFDSGSNWIEVILSNKEAVVLFGWIVKKASELVREEYLQWRQTGHVVNTLKVDQQAKEQILKALEDSVTTRARSQAKALNQEFNISDNHAEYESGLTHSIKTLAGLIYEGAEVHAALNAPEETQNVYPEVKEVREIINNSVKLLPDEEFKTSKVEPRKENERIDDDKTDESQGEKE